MLTLLKYAFNIEASMRKLSPFISSLVISTQFTLQMCAKNLAKSLFWWLKVVQGYRCRYFWKARQQCLLRQSACLCLAYLQPFAH